MFTELEALLVIKFLKQCRETTEKNFPHCGPAQTAYYQLVNAGALLAIDANLSPVDIVKEITPSPAKVEV